LFWREGLLNGFYRNFHGNSKNFIAVDFPSEVIKEVARAGNFE
jgi:hypothetical protein